MNKVTLIGRLTRDPDIRSTQGENSTAMARYTMAVDRKIKRQEGKQEADFISCVAFGRQAEFAEKYLHKGTKIAVNGRIQTGSYTNREGQKVYTTDVVIEDHEFVESRQAAGQTAPQSRPQNGSQSRDNFMYIPDGIEEDLPFS